MKRKLFCILLSLMMVIAMMPAMTVTAFAADATDMIADLIGSLTGADKSDIEKVADTVKAAKDIADTIKDTAEDIEKYVDSNYCKVTVTAGTNGKVNQYLPDIVPKSSSISVDGNKIRIGLLNTVTATPSKGYEFSGWTDNMGAIKSGKITKETTITALFKEKVFAVKFEMNGIGTAPQGQNVIYSSKIAKPIEPTSPGYIFEGWYKDAACKTPWDFYKDTISEDTTLYAKWTEDLEQKAIEAQLAEQLQQELLEAQLAKEKLDKALEELEIRCTTSKVDKGIKVTAKVTAGDIDVIKEAGYTVVYKFYRSTKPYEGYKYMLTSQTGKYKNTSVKKGKTYYYKAVVVVTDDEDNVIKKTSLYNCKYGSRKYK